MKAYYNENDPFAAAWLRNLIAAGHIADGDVDERSIVDVRPADLDGYTQCHFFAGIGGWPCSLRLAGWPDDRPVWTGSCPCQPGSVAGRQRGFKDERHLWPIWQELIAEQHPSTIFGEQVAAWSAWIALVRGDLEALDYAVGAIPMEAASAGGYQLRDRYLFVARSNNTKRWATQSARHQSTGKATGWNESHRDLTERSRGGLVCPQGFGWGEGWSEYEIRSRGLSAAVASVGDSQIIKCPDGKWRPLPPPRVRWVGNEIFARVDKLRALGNAIDPHATAQFILAAIGAIGSVDG